MFALKCLMLFGRGLLLLSAFLPAFGQTPNFTSIPNTASGPTFLIATADFNGDNKPDIAVTAAVSSTISLVDVFLNNGDGSTRKSVTLTMPSVADVTSSDSVCVPFSLATGDFLKHGKQDLLVVCSFSAAILVYPGNGDGTFGDYVLSTAPTGVLAFLDEFKVAVGDFNGDGFLDIAFASFSNAEVTDKTGALAAPLAVLLGTGTGKFLNIKPISVTGVSLAAADLNHDGKLDLVVSQPNRLSFNFLYGLPTSPGPLQILIGKGDGTFTTGQNIPLTFAPGPVTIADVNGDGKPDIIVDGLLGGMAVLLGNGDGTFKQSFSLNASFATAGTIQAVDLLGTGKPGLLVPVATCCSKQVIFLPGNGDGTFGNYIPIATGIDSPNAVVADFNGDGKPDLALTSFPVNITNIGDLLTNVRNIDRTYSSVFQIEINRGVAPAITFANGASFANGTLAAGSIVSAFAAGGLAAGTDTPSTIPLPVTDQGASVTVKDSAGSIRQAALFYVSPTQINYQLPDATAAGMATISLNYLGQTSSAQQQIAAVAPGIFQANTATHLLSADVTIAHADGSQTLGHTYQVNAANQVVALPVSLGSPTDQVFLTMYGTGIKNAHTVAATIGATTVPVAFFGAQGAFVGLDQLNIGPVPKSLAGAGNVNLSIMADTVPANTVNFVIQ